ncbi:hypothetical protein NJ76_27615 [Rhodococcus sp. IITR03]|nr:hypothetical protein NJ76_27615 [Rhodococcus sp. IITR03]
MTRYARLGVHRDLRTSSSSSRSVVEQGVTSSNFEPHQATGRWDTRGVSASGSAGYCSFTKAIEHLGDRWSLLVVRQLGT